MKLLGKTAGLGLSSGHLFLPYGSPTWTSVRGVTEMAADVAKSGTIEEGGVQHSLLFEKQKRGECNTPFSEIFKKGRGEFLIFLKFFNKNAILKILFLFL